MAGGWDGAQDDDLLEPADCSWLPKLVQQMDAMPSLAMVGFNRLQLSHGPGNELNANNFMDPNTSNHMIFAFQVSGHLAFGRGIQGPSLFAGGWSRIVVPKCHQWMNQKEGRPALASRIPMDGGTVAGGNGAAAFSAKRHGVGSVHQRRF